MSLYGDNGNVRILERRLKDQGFDVEIIKRTITDSTITFDDADFVYMGSGFESNRNLVAKHLAQFKDGLVTRQSTTAFRCSLRVMLMTFWEAAL